MTKDYASPPSSPQSTRPPVSRSYKTPERDHDHAVKEMRSIEQQTKEQTTSLPTKDVGIATTCSLKSTLPLATSPMTEGSAIDPLHLLAQAAETTDHINTYYTVTTFDKEIDAMNLCYETLPFGDKKHIGVALNDYNNYSVYTTAKTSETPFKMENIPDDVKWIWIKAYDKGLVAKREQCGRRVKPYTLVRVLQDGVQRTIHKRGIYRQVYRLPDGKLLKLIHHSCDLLNAVTHSEKRIHCRNCEHPSWNAKCSAGEDFWILT
tara:strand:- start:250 stop:1038 length:789 start_codon:yes stop_codon:yes gene_type:complete